MADFESGFWPALHATFPLLLRKGCLFHFMNAVFKLIKQRLLVRWWANNFHEHTSLALFASRESDMLISNSHKLQVAYNYETTGLRAVIRKFFALTFLWPDRTEDQIDNGVERSDLVTVFDGLVVQLYALQSETIPIATLIQFVAYFTNTWMSNLTRLNVFHLDDHRTNNDLEGTFIHSQELPW